MRAIPIAMSDAVQAGVTQFAHVWRVTRTDGVQFAFTDHDRALDFDGLVCEPSAGVASGAVEKSLGLGIDSASFSGALSSPSITESDLVQGVWDGAGLDLFLVDWTAPLNRVHVFAGRLGEVRRGANGFEAEARGLQAALDTPGGRVFSRFCGADVGDVRCGVALNAPEVSGSGVVVQVLDVRSFLAGGIESFVDGWFSRGRLTWGSGAGGEVATHRASGDGAIIELLDPPGASMAAGAAFSITAGCDKRHATCRDKFANMQNFRGFVHMPGNDAVQSGPVAGEALDSSSRWL